MSDTCLWCHADISERRVRKDRRFCSNGCGTYWRRAERRQSRIAAALLKRPRCMICSKPMPYGKPGFNFRAVTCSMACHVKRNNWFVRG